MVSECDERRGKDPCSTPYPKSGHPSNERKRYTVKIHIDKAHRGKPIVTTCEKSPRSPCPGEPTVYPKSPCNGSILRNRKCCRKTDQPCQTNPFLTQNQSCGPNVTCVHKKVHRDCQTSRKQYAHCGQQTSICGGGNTCAKQCQTELDHGCDAVGVCHKRDKCFRGNSEAMACRNKHAFPFVGRTPSGNLKIRPNMVSYESKEFGILVANQNCVRTTVKRLVSCDETQQKQPDCKTMPMPVQPEEVSAGVLDSIYYSIHSPTENMEDIFSDSSNDYLEKHHRKRHRPKLKHYYSQCHPPKEKNYPQCYPNERKHYPQCHARERKHHHSRTNCCSCSPPPPPYLTPSPNYNTNPTHPPKQEMPTQTSLLMSYLDYLDPYLKIEPPPFPITPKDKGFDILDVRILPPAQANAEELHTPTNHQPPQSWKYKAPAPVFPPNLKPRHNHKPNSTHPLKQQKPTQTLLEERLDLSDPYPEPESPPIPLTRKGSVFDILDLHMPLPSQVNGEELHTPANQVSPPNLTPRQNHNPNPFAVSHSPKQQMPTQTSLAMGLDHLDRHPHLETEPPPIPISPKDTAIDILDAHIPLPSQVNVEEHHTPSNHPLSLSQLSKDIVPVPLSSEAQALIVQDSTASHDIPPEAAVEDPPPIPEPKPRRGSKQKKRASLVEDYNPKFHPGKSGVLPNLDTQSGSILVLGGINPLMLCGPENTGRDVFMYTLDVNKWTHVGILPFARAHCGAARVGNYIYLIGGGNPEEKNENGKSIPVRSNLRLNLRSGEWDHQPDLEMTRSHFGCVALGQNIYVIGGNVDTKPTTSCLVFNTEDQTWKSIASLPRTRTSMGIAILGENIVVAGGATKEAKRPMLDTVLKYEPSLDSWTSLKSLPSPRAFCTMAVVNERIFVIAGAGIRDISKRKNSSLNDILIYDTEKEEWEPFASLTTQRHGHSSAVIGDSIVVVGGVTSLTMGPLDSVEILSASTGEIREGKSITGSSSGGKSGMSVVVLSSTLPAS